MLVDSVHVGRSMLHLCFVSLPDGADQHRARRLFLALPIGLLVLGADALKGSVEFPIFVRTPVGVKVKVSTAEIPTQAA